MRKTTVSVLLMLCALPALAAWPGAIESGIWQLPSSQTGTRWLVIHNLASAEADGVYHVEILERSFGAEAWNIKHIADHMAVSSAALRASIVKPLTKGAVYPDSFNYAYAEWKKQEAQGKALVCTSSVLECLK
jgi:hypothetical protein